MKKLVKEVRNWLKVKFNFLNLIEMTDCILDYSIWQSHFLYQRLKLVIWIAILCVFSFALFSLSISQCNNTFTLCIDHNIIIETAIAVCLIGCLVLHRSNFGKSHPGVVFLATSWSISLVNQILLTFLGTANEQVWFWTLVFLTQAVLVPVHWRLHLLSQLVVLFYFFGVNVSLDLVPERTVSYLPIIPLYMAWICVICNLGVYLYERLKIAELESRREIQLFLHAISHDLRNPVTGMLLVLQNLSKEGCDDETISISCSTVTKMIKGGNHQLNLINSLLESYDNNLQKIATIKQSIQLNFLVEELIINLEPFLIKNQTIVKNHVSSDLPLIRGDRTQLWRVWQNLITNAINHNPSGVILTLRAEVIQNNAKQLVRCEIQDNGIGISQKQCRTLFNRYSRGYNNRRVGLGLGLYLCREIIKAHGGQIGVISELGSGAKFWFTLPIA